MKRAPGPGQLAFEIFPGLTECREFLASWPPLPPPPTLDFADPFVVNAEPTGLLIPGREYVRRVASRTCLVPTCNTPWFSWQLCQLHGMRWRRTGDPLGVRGKPRGAASHRWKGDDIGYSGAHVRVKVVRGPARGHECRRCGGPARDWAYDHSDPDERIGFRDGKRLPFSLDPERYEPLCSRCHRLEDLLRALTDG